MSEPEMDSPKYDLSVSPAEAPESGQAKKVASRLGFALLVMMVCHQGLGYLLGVLAAALEDKGIFLTDTSWFMWVASCAPLYLIGMPLGYLIMKKAPVAEAAPGKLKFGHWLLFLLMSFPLMYGGSLIGTLLSQLLTGGAAANLVQDFAMQTGILKVVFMVILAPCMEELFFRRLLVDRLSPYGEKTAILFSGLAFGLFHGNLFQFFYAFLLGMLFAYVYVRTRKLRYSIGLHMVINAIGAVAAPAVLSGMDPDTLEQLSSGTALTDPELAAELLPQIAGLALFGLAVILLFAAGLIVLILKLPKFRYKTAPLELPKGSGFKTVYCSPGVILFIAACLALIVYILLR